MQSETLLPQTALHIWNHLKSSAQIYNLYGPAECTLISTFHLITQDDLHLHSIPIGGPLVGYTCHVLDTYLQPILIQYHIGELWIGGDAVFSGYLRRPDLSKQSLIHVSHTESLLYRTGDLVRIEHIIHQIKELSLAVLSCSVVPYQDVIGRNLFSSVIFAVEEFSQVAMGNYTQLDSGARLHPIDMNTNKIGHSKFDLSCDICHGDSSGGITLSITGSLDIFDQATMDVMAHRFECLFDQIFDLKPISGLSLLFNEEYEILNDLNNTSVHISSIGCMHHDFMRRAEYHSQKIAVILEHQSLTYGETFYYVQLLALHLITDIGLRIGDRVYQYVERSIEMVIGIWAILMSGCVYVPAANLAEHTDRLRDQILAINPTTVLVSDGTSFSDFEIVSLNIGQYLNKVMNNNHIVNFNCLLQRISSTMSEDYAHIILTSGSTGQPKAVQIRHKNFVSYARNHLFAARFTHVYTISADDIVLQHTQSSFDVHVEEVCATLMNGGQLVLLRPYGHLDADYVTKLICEHNVSHMNLVPAQIASLSEQFHCYPMRARSLRSVASAGESILVRTSLKLLSCLPLTCTLYNSYGPAETTQSATGFVISHCETTLHNSLSTIVPIGRLLPNYQALLLDIFLQPVCIGQPSELFIGGNGLFNGYYNRPDLTQQWDHTKSTHNPSEIIAPYDYLNT
ncbi:hypothetical protein I4U23_031544 [Adineta vaga]|nr:hypothetical protein I4U23_031544 [Adineta vaga]